MNHVFTCSLCCISLLLTSLIPLVADLQGVRWFAMHSLAICAESFVAAQIAVCSSCWSVAIARCWTRCARLASTLSSDSTSSLTTFKCAHLRCMHAALNHRCAAAQEAVTALLRHQVLPFVKPAIAVNFAASCFCNDWRTCPQSEEDKPHEALEAREDCCTAVTRLSVAIMENF